MNPLFLLDTNTISNATSRRSPGTLQRIAREAPERLCASSISYGEIWFGLNRRPEATKLAEATRRLFAEIDVLPWTAATGDRYARLRAAMETLGKSLAPLDMLIAAHAVEIGATLVTSDRAFRFVPGLDVEDWHEA